MGGKAVNLVEYGIHPDQLKALHLPHGLLTESHPDDFGLVEYVCTCGESARLHPDARVFRGWMAHHAAVLTHPDLYGHMISMHPDPSASDRGRLRCVCGWSEDWDTEKERRALIMLHRAETELEQVRK